MFQLTTRKYKGTAIDNKTGEKVSVEGEVQVAEGAPFFKAVDAVRCQLFLASHTAQELEIDGRPVGRRR